MFTKLIRKYFFSSFQVYLLIAFLHYMLETAYYTKVQVGKDQEKAQSEKDSHSKTEVGKNQTKNQVLIP